MLNFIINPEAGGGKARTIMLKMEDYIKSSGISYSFYYTKFPKHATEIAFNLAKSGEKRIVCCGGDGTINEIVNGIMLAGEKDIILGFLPCGTGNDFMRSAGLPLSAAEALAIILQGVTKQIDCIDISGIKMVCFSNAGIDAEVVKLCNSEPKKTKISYVKNILKCIFKANYNYNLQTEEGVFKGNGAIISVLNGLSIGSGVPYCPKAEIDDGYMDVMVIKTTKKMQLTGCLLNALRGKLLSSKHVYYIKCKRAEIKTSADAVDIDGELFYGLDYVAEICEKALVIYSK